jgi:competence protein ComEC
MGAARVTVLDVGQGLSVVIETNAHTLVYDTGPAFRTGSDTGQLVVVPFLQSRGLVELDALVVSHDDSDHRGGATSVLEQVPTATVWTGPGVALAGLEPAHQHAVCRRGVRWQWDGVEFAFLHPEATPLATDNDSSCVLHVRAGEHAVLLPGDVERAAEAEMLVRGDVTQATVVVVPHHGSRTSSTPELVEATRPRFVAYAVGHRNRWNFPKPEVVGRWQAVGAADLRTSASGAITFELSPGRPLSAPAQWRPGHPRPWRDP